MKKIILTAILLSACSQNYEDDSVCLYYSDESTQQSFTIESNREYTCFYREISDENEYVSYNKESSKNLCDAVYRKFDELPSKDLLSPSSNHFLTISRSGPPLVDGPVDPNKITSIVKFIENECIKE